MAGIISARIKVVGIGGAGCNAADWLYKKGLTGAQVICINTDQQHLSCVEADKKILLGNETAKGLGCGGNILVGREAAMDSKKVLQELLSDTDMVFLIAGLGGGTGTGAIPYLAELAKENGTTVVSTVTIPFSTEGAKKKEKADIGLEELGYTSDTVIVIDNNKLVELAGNLPLQQAFAVANELISVMIKSVVEIITVPSLVNLDYADVKAIMEKGGVSIIGFGESNTQTRVKDAVEMALKHPLLEVNYDKAKGALIHISGGADLTLNEVNEAGQLISKVIKDEDGEVVWGARVDQWLEGIRVMTIITGVASPQLTGVSCAKGNFRELGIDKLGGRR